jgi:hypothetical protein
MEPFSSLKTAVRSDKSGQIVQDCASRQSSRKSFCFNSDIAKSGRKSKDNIVYIRKKIDNERKNQISQNRER